MFARMKAAFLTAIRSPETIEMVAEIERIRAELDSYGRGV
jgi:hypothetical protein